MLQPTAEVALRATFIIDLKAWCASHRQRLVSGPNVDEIPGCWTGCRRGVGGVQLEEGRGDAHRQTEARRLSKMAQASEASAAGTYAA